MALLSASGLEKSYGTDTIFSGVSFEIQENERIGLVGVNGAGLSWFPSCFMVLCI